MFVTCTLFRSLIKVAVEGKTKLYISSQVGQKYMCQYNLQPDSPDDVSETPSVAINITKLLEPMRGTCLFKVCVDDHGLPYCILTVSEIKQDGSCRLEPTESQFVFLRFFFTVDM